MKNDHREKLKIIPLGGLEDIGMNITVFEYGDSIIAVDCGIAFPDEEMPGIDLVIPDVTYLIENQDRFRGFVITHGHEDHIGALPYVLRDLRAPIYATRLTMALIEHKLEEFDLGKVRRKTVQFGQTITLGCFRIEFIRTNHSIVDAAALAIHTPAGVVVHTGDFKIDYTPVFGDTIDLQRFAEIGKKGVLALLCDSTNAIRSGFTMSESSVGHTFDAIFSEHIKKRIIVATFSSNVDRVQQVINSAVKFHRKVLIEGRSMINIISTATELGYIRVPDNVLIDISEMNNLPPENIVIVTTGSQGESMAALSRMAADIHKSIEILPTDTVVFSSNPIPGNEKAIYKVVNELSAKGAEIILQDTHVSGHAKQEEIKLIYTLLKPKYAIPVHGEYRHLTAQAKLLQELGYSSDRIFILHSGDVLALDEKSAEVVDSVQAGSLLVDGLGVGDVGNAVLRERHHLAENGIVVVALTLDAATGELLCGPEISSRGFVYVKESDDLIHEIEETSMDVYTAFIKTRNRDRNRLKNDLRQSLSGFLWKKTKRRPVILPVIMEVE